MDNRIKKSGMETMIDPLRLPDDRKTKKGGQALSSGDFKHGAPDKPAVKGPLTDYHHVVREDFFRHGEYIVKEGNHGKWIWAVYKGTVRVIKDRAGGTLTLARLGEGCFIGTLRALLFGEYQRNATVIAEGDVRLCLLDAEPFYHEYSRLSPGFRRLLLSLDQRLRMLNKRAVELYFSSKEECRPFIPGNPVEKLKIEKELYRIVSGNAALISKEISGRKQIITLGENDVIGNLPFIDFGHEPVSAWVIPSKDLITEKMDRGEILREYESLSKTFKGLIFNIGNYLSSTTGLVRDLGCRN